MDKANGDDDVKFHSEEKPFLDKNVSNKRAYGCLLTREDLIRLDAEEPVWRRVRIILLAVFWILWIGLLAASITVIILTPSCPPVPKLSFWQSKVGYWVDPFAFVDSGRDLIGDLKGLTSRMDYIKDTVGAGFIILDSFVSGQFTNEQKTLGLVDDFWKIDTALGTLEDFRSMIKSCHRNGLEVVVSLDFNAISVSHPWTKQSSLLQKPVSNNLYSRSGSAPSVNIGGVDYYSVGDEHSVDLDLTSAEVVERLKKVVDFWLKEGADGIMLTSASFYVEDANATVSILAGAKSGEANKWFTNYPYKQLFTDGSIQFVRKIRQVVDQISSRSGKPRLLAVDAGNCGYGIHFGDDSVAFLGDAESPGAHLVISRHFVKDRGWKTILSDVYVNYSLAMYDGVLHRANSSLAFVTASPSDQRHDDAIALAATFLLPGTTVLYYGSELLIQLRPVTVPPTDFYPKGKSPFPNLSERDSALTSHLPMPWDRSGVGFSRAVFNSSFATYMKQFDPLETVESASAFGRGETGLSMVQQLVKLRQNPSLLWGEFKLLQADRAVDPKLVELFVRKAEGYPAFIVAFIRATPGFGSVFSFADVCSQVTLRFKHPATGPTFELNKFVDSSRIYLSTDVEPAIYVFECLAN